MKSRLMALALSGAAMLTACGGGGDSGNSGFTPPTDDFAVLIAYQRLLGNGGSWSVSGTGNDGLPYSATFSFAPAAATNFPVTGASLSRAVLTSALRQGMGPANTVVAEFFREVDYRIQGARYTVDNGVPVCSRSTGTPSLPAATAKVGASGALVTLDDLAGCVAGSASVGSTVTTWSVAFERGVVMFCLDSIGRDTAGREVGRESDCVGMSPDGTLGNTARVTITQPGGFILTMRNF